MFQLFLSIALAAGAPEASPVPMAAPTTQTKPAAKPTPISLSETASKLNEKLPEEQKIIIPSAGSRQFFVKINDFKLGSSNSKITKDVLKISNLSIQGCNAYAWDFGGDLHLTEFSKAFKIAKDHIANEKSLPQALQLVRIGLMATQCKGPIIFNAIGAEWLKSSLDLLKSLPHKKAKKDDKMRLQALQEQVLALSDEKILKESLRFETVTSSALVARAIEEGHASSWYSGEEPNLTAEKPDFWQQFTAEKKFKLDWDLHTQITTDLLSAIAESKGPEFKKYRDLVNKDYNDGLEGLWKDLALTELGFQNANELKNEKKVIALVSRLEKDEAALKSFRQKLTEHPQISAYLFKIAQQHLSVQEEFFVKFDTKLNDIKALARVLTK